MAITSLLLLTTAAILTLTSLPEQQSLNPTTFARFTVTSKQQISPTAFILTVAPSDVLPRSGALATLSDLVLPSRSPARAAERHAKQFADVWERGVTWSVEVKQPLLQVAREYTPLPELDPLGTVEEEDGASLRARAGKPELKFLIRRTERGEVSGYLSALNAGDEVQLRGPHVGFDVRQRLGSGDRGGRRIVFLAGGTGIAPALQVVRAVLADEEGQRDGGEGTKVDVLWANRQRADCRACPSLGSAGELQGGAEQGPVLELLAEIQRRYPGRVTVRCAVDEERSFVEMGALARVVKSEARRRDDGGEGTKGCWLHDQDAVARRPAADVDVDVDAETGRCRCGGGKNLLFVSGPDGFVEHFAGPKRWADGMELQGPVGGVLGKLGARYPDVMREWLVLKL